jgi:hypothetical protein
MSHESDFEEAKRKLEANAPASTSGDDAKG